MGAGVGAGGFGCEGFDDGLGALPVRGLRETGARAAEREVLRDSLEDRRGAVAARVRRDPGFDVRGGLAGAKGRTNGSTEMI